MNSLSLAVRGQAMPSVISRKIQRIFIYLLATIGIVFLILLITRGTSEGFQSGIPSKTDIDKYRDLCIERTRDTGSGTSCRTVMYGDQKLHLCEDEKSALDLLQCDHTFSHTITPDIMKDVDYLKLKDSVCYKSELTKTYVCYNRPPLLGYDTDLNATLFINPGIPGMDDLDPVPSDIDNVIPAICPSYEGSYTLMQRGISSIGSQLSNVNTNLSVLSNVYNTLNTLNTQYCYTDPNRSGTKQQICNSIGTNLPYFFNTLNSPATTKITGTLTSNLDELNSIRDRQLIPAYNGFNCTTPKV